MQAIANEIAANEIGLVTFLKTALGPAALPIARIDFTRAFAAFANAALNTTLSPPFSPYENHTLFPSFTVDAVHIIIDAMACDVAECVEAAVSKTLMHMHSLRVLRNCAHD